MTPTERRAAILRLIHERDFVRVAELKQVLCVSDMTLHRDLHWLEAQHKLVRSHGEVKRTRSPGEATPSSPVCCMCGKRPSLHSEHRAICRDGVIRVYCCMHCRMIDQLPTEAVLSETCRDTLYETTVSTANAWVVIGADIVHPCCMPGAFSFQARTLAECFARGFGGEVLTWSKASDSLRKLVVHHGCTRDERS